MREPRKYGCHVEVEAGNPPYTYCVVERDAHEDCGYSHTPTGRKRKTPNTCPHWKPIGPSPSDLRLERYTEEAIS